MYKFKYYSLFLIILFVSCNKDSGVITSEGISDNAKSYLNSALDIMQQYSINRYKIDWPPFRQKTLDYARSAKTEKDTYDAIRYALVNLGDNHSFFQPPLKSISKIYFTIPMGFENLINLKKIAADPTGQRINKNIGFIRIPAFSGSGQNMIDFANSIQKIIKDVDTSSINAWIVDLRQNTGGNMWPMLAGVGPILGEGLVGKFVDPDNKITNWYYEKGASKSGNFVIARVANYYTLINSNPKVAVLTDNRTASSGEAITVSFKGRDKTRSFGDLTYGVSTANAGYALRDGAMIYLTVATFADRNGTLYGGKIKPDEVIIADFKNDPIDNDKVVETAIKWLENNF